MVVVCLLPKRLSFLSLADRCLVAWWQRADHLYTRRREENVEGSWRTNMEVAVSPKRALRNKSSRRRSASVRVSTRSLALSLYSIYWRSASYVACAIVDWVMDFETQYVAWTSIGHGTSTLLPDQKIQTLTRIPPGHGSQRGKLVGGVGGWMSS